MPESTHKPTTPSALLEKQGVTHVESTSAASIARFKAKRKKQIEPEKILAGIIAHDIVSLSQGITLVESLQQTHKSFAQQIIQGALPYANKSVRIGITGVPGVGKSTFIESFGKFLTNAGRKVAVLAIDPSSSITHGSILGDKTRMEELVNDPNAYIRPSASGDSLGGVARKTRESIILCEAAGFDTILVETVGVGQSETAVHSMVDFFLLLNLAGAGDELQGIKRGIMEMADAVIINKADGENIDKARLAKLAYNRAIHLFPAKNSAWIPKVRTCSALHHTGIERIYQMIENFLTLTKDNGYFNKHRADQNQYWMMETIHEAVLAQFHNTLEVDAAITINKKAVQNGEISPFAAANEILDLYFKRNN